jgi:hypothetical protein
MQLVAKSFRESELEAPHPNEHEPAYTARCLVPLVRGFVQRLDIPGLVEAGEGASRVRPVPVFGLLFFPDLTVTYHRERILAFEVKFLGHGGRQNSIATALGQAYLYREGGYRRTGAFLIDDARILSDEDITYAEERLRSAGIEIVVRRRRGDILDPHPG